jgi:hypothetical protein
VKLLIAAVLAVVLVSSMAFVSRRTPSRMRGHELDVRSPYRNTRPEV